MSASEDFKEKARLFREQEQKGTPPIPPSKPKPRAKPAPQPEPEEEDLTSLPIKERMRIIRERANSGASGGDSVPSRPSPRTVARHSASKPAPAPAPVTPAVAPAKPKPRTAPVPVKPSSATAPAGSGAPAPDTEASKPKKGGIAEKLAALQQQGLNPEGNAPSPRENASPRGSGSRPTPVFPPTPPVNAKPASPGVGAPTSTFGGPPPTSTFGGAPPASASSGPPPPSVVRKPSVGGVKPSRVAQEPPSTAVDTGSSAKISDRIKALQSDPHGSGMFGSGGRPPVGPPPPVGHHAAPTAAHPGPPPPLRSSGHHAPPKPGMPSVPPPPSGGLLSIYSQRGPRAIADFDFEAVEADDLGLRKDDGVTLLEKLDADWYRGRNLRTGREGMFPSNFVHVIEDIGAVSSTPSPAPAAAAAAASAGVAAAAAAAAGGGYRAPAPSSNSGGDPFADKLVRSDAARALVEHDFRGDQPGDLPLVVGEVIKLTARIDADWLEGENSRGQQGMFPANFVLVQKEPGAPAPAAADEPVVNASNFKADASASPAGCCLAVYDYNSGESGDLTFKAGDMIHKVTNVDKDWLSGMVAGREGMFPANFVEYVFRAHALYDFTGQSADELSFLAGDYINIDESIDSDWMRGTMTSTGVSGIFPANFVEPA
eukprot:Clim_evm70s25 gene=Clim_evmTU70s25